MTHFNHDWDTTKNPAVPVSVGDRYYAQDLNDDFNYTKHLPYEVLLQNREDGVLIPPTPSYNSSTHVLSLTGGLSAKKIACATLDEEETFVLPPKTKSVLRYERIGLLDVTLTLSQNNVMQYIVATPTKKSLLERTKALMSEKWYCRGKYDGIITLQDTAPLSNQILIGLALNDEYLLLQDTINQCEKSICIKCWNGVNKISSSLITALQTHYNTTISTITGNITISDTTSMNGIDGGSFLNCVINAVVNGGVFDHCSVSGKILSGTFKYCNISASVAGDGSIADTIFNHCDVTNIEDSANFTASNSILTYPAPQNALEDIYADQCTIKIQATITGDAFASFKDCKLTNVDVYTTNNPPTISPLETYLSSFVTWSQTGSPIVQLCTGVDNILDDNITSLYKSWSSKKIAQNNLHINTMAVYASKTIPSYYEEEGASLKVIFKNGHNAVSTSEHMTINGKLVVSNQNGSLLPIPIHEIKKGGSTVYKVVGANIAIELYYIADYDGANTPAFVVIGNPVVLNSTDYTIYADGQMGGCPPINATYVQYPQCKSPQEIWFTATWVELDYGGAFFRASGGNANAFIEEGGALSKQFGQNASHSHRISLTTTSNGYHSHSLIVNSSHDDSGADNSTAFRTDENYQTYARTMAGGNGTSATGTHAHDINGDTQANGGSECRPDNYTIRIWKRTA